MTTSLEGLLPAADAEVLEPDEIFDRFVDWTSSRDLTLYPAQEQALLELVSDQHVILDTPTGSGKSLVAAGLHFKAMCEGTTSFYTAPIKALVSEKFFALCEDFGAEHVGMLTGDASINSDAPIVCCTAEILANLAVRRGIDLDVAAVVMDEFHYYSDLDRGTAWQIPLITLPRTQFLLMSATLGNPAPIRERLEDQTNRGAVVVSSKERPVPLERVYEERPLHETVQELRDQERAPIYIVSFTQRECAELAQSLTSLKLTDKEHKARLREEIGDFRFDTAYGKEMRRFLSFGIGVHHAGLLPKYRLLVERLAQKGLLVTICGTDTLGVGVNVPIRTVLFRRLSKYNGQEVALLKVRDFQQIAGRAGRKGFDDLGWVYCQAPEHVIENLKLSAKAAGNPKKAKKLVKKKPPPNFVPWDQATFERLATQQPEQLTSQFSVSHGLVLDTIHRDAELNDPEQGNFSTLRYLIERSHETPKRRTELTTEAASLVWSLYRAGILRLERDTQSSYRWVTTAPDLQIEFSLFHNLSLFLVQQLETLDPGSESYVTDLLSFVEAVLEDPHLVLRRQADKLKDELIARLKAEGVEYEERMEKLQEVTHPRPNAEAIYRAFNVFRAAHPWVAGDNIKPKGVGAEMWTEFSSFEDFVRRYGIHRFEGTLLRYVSQLYKTLTQNVPQRFKTEALYDLLGYFRAMLERVDTSLLDEWERLLDPASGLGRLAGTEAGDEAIAAYELVDDPKAMRARVRGALHLFTRALARQDYEEASLLVGTDPSADPPSLASPAGLEEALRPFYDDYDEIVFTPEARQAHFSILTEPKDGDWSFRQVLLDPEGENFWCLEGSVDRAVLQGRDDESQLLRLARIGT